MKLKTIKFFNSCFHKFGIHVSRYKIGSNLRQATIEAKKHFGNKKIVVCEIGTFLGEHAIELLENLNIEKIYLIDPYEKYPGYKEKVSDYIRDVEKRAHKNLKKYEKKIIWLKKYSDDAIKDIKEKLDFLYIDGNHTSPYVNNDIKNYFPLVKKGGIISGHDYNSNLPDVVYAVNDFFYPKKKKVIVGNGTDWVVFL